MKSLVCKILFLFVVGGMLFTPVVFVQAADAPLITREGVMSELEEDGSVVIDNQGFILGSRVEILDSQGRYLPREELALPARIIYEFRYTPQGPVILRVRMKPAIPM
jgi:hypothetical protein